MSINLTVLENQLEEFDQAVYETTAKDRKDDYALSYLREYFDLCDVEYDCDKDIVLTIKDK